MDHVLGQIIRVSSTGGVSRPSSSGCCSSCSSGRRLIMLVRSSIILSRSIICLQRSTRGRRLTCGCIDHLIPQDLLYMVVATGGSDCIVGASRLPGGTHIKVLCQCSWLSCAAGVGRLCRCRGSVLWLSLRGDRLGRGMNSEGSEGSGCKVVPRDEIGRGEAGRDMEGAL